jgi:hypothetical protein
MQNKQVNETKGEGERRFFDPSVHKADPDLMVLGEGMGHVWEESTDSIEVCVVGIYSLYLYLSYCGWELLSNRTLFYTS